MNRADPAFFQIRLATTPRDLMAAQRLRYRVFVEELGGSTATANTTWPRCATAADRCWNWGGPVSIPITGAGRRCS